MICYSSYYRVSEPTYCRIEGGTSTNKNYEEVALKQEREEAHNSYRCDRETKKSYRRAQDSVDDQSAISVKYQIIVCDLENRRSAPPTIL